MTEIGKVILKPGTEEWFEEMRERNRKGLTGELVKQNANRDFEDEDYSYRTDEKGREYITAKPALLIREWNQRCKRADLEPPPLPFDANHEIQQTHYDLLLLGDRNAIFYGEPGRGKSLVMLSALRQLASEGESVGMVRCETFDAQMLPGHQKATGMSPLEVIHQIGQHRILMVDEIAYGRISEYQSERMFDLISFRDSKGLLTWFTSNIHVDELAKIYGPALMSRMNRNGNMITKGFDEMPDYREGAE